MPDESIPLARLFVMAAGQPVSRLHGRLREEGWDEIRPSYGFVLFRIREEPSTISALAAFLGITEQAGSKLIERMEQLGLVETGRHPADPRARAVVITEEGARLLKTAEDVYAGLEAEWGEIIGGNAIKAMRRPHGRPSRDQRWRPAIDLADLRRAVTTLGLRPLPGSKRSTPAGPVVHYGTSPVSRFDAADVRCDG